MDPRKVPDEVFELWSIPAYDAGIPELLRGRDIGSSKKVVYPDDILLSRIIPHIRRAWVVKENSDKRCQIASTEWIIFSSHEVIPEFLRRIIISDPFHVRFMQTITGVGGSLARANPSAVADIQIPLPPLGVQREIVAEIEGYQRVIDGARAVIDNYRPQIVVDPEWPMVALGETISLEYGKPLKAENRTEGPYPVFGSNGIVGYHNECLIDGPVIIVGRKGSAGAVNFCESPCYPIDTTFFVRTREQQRLDIRFCYYQMLELELDKVNVQSGVPGLNRNDAYLKTIALPPLETQQAIVAEIEAEQSLVAANRELVERMEGKIRAAIGRVWGDE